MAIEIKLKAKYTAGGRGGYKSPGGNTGAKRKRRTKSKSPVPQPVMTMVIGPSGKRRMVRENAA